MNIKDFLSQTIILDKMQLALLDKLDVISDNLAAKEKKKYFNLSKSRYNIKHGIYLYGGVGCGKSMLMKGFYNKLVNIATIIHYQDFMSNIHKNLHVLQKDKTIEVIAKLASDYAKKWRVICLDELEIKDITDAMIVSNLFIQLSKHNIFIFITSNTKPDELYKDGLQRESFLPFISHINTDFEVLLLENNCDYRLYRAASFHRVFYPFNIKTKIETEKIILKLTNQKLVENSDIEIFGRLIRFKQAYQNVLITDFQELCMQEFGYVDYVNICQKFNIIFLKNVTYISDNNNDLITRFINFIDNAYFYRVLLYISLEDIPTKIYPQGKYANDFKRTISRLHEMNSDEYVKHTKY